MKVISVGSKTSWSRRAGAAWWCVAVFALYGVLVWMLDTPHVPHYLLMLLAILAIPLARLSAAPLALAWNRHR